MIRFWITKRRPVHGYAILLSFGGCGYVVTRGIRTKRKAVVERNRLERECLECSLDFRMSVLDTIMESINAVPV